MSESKEPESNKPESAHKPSRRPVLFWLAWGLGTAAAAAVAAPVVGYFFGSLGEEPVRWVSLGPIDRFPQNEYRLETFENPSHTPWDGASSATAAYVRYLGKDASGADQFWVFAMNCTHLGCPVSWFPQSGLFLCPCHGGVYYENGDRAAGPPPRGLYHMPWRVRNGVLEVEAPHLPTLQDTLEKPSKLVQLGLMKRDQTA